MSFTQVMLSRYAADIELATQAPFLRLAGEHALGRDVLSEWLTQDKMYAFEGCESQPNECFMTTPGRH